MKQLGEETNPIALCEPVPVEDVFVSGISMIEDHGGWLRFEFFVAGETLYGPSHVIVARLVTTPESFETMLALAIEKARAAPRIRPRPGWVN